MSCYNSEYGEIKIPSAEMVDLRKEIVRAYNKRQEALRERFNRKVEGFRAEVKNGKSIRDIVWDANLDTDMQSLLYKKHDSKTGYIKKCYKKDIDLKKISAQRVSLSDGELYVTLDTENRTLTWSVEENNRAVESAEKSDLGRDVLGALGRVNWCRDSGGIVKYADEYQRDAYQGPSVSRRFGPNGKRAGW